jgi:hypothetical protein
MSEKGNCISLMREFRIKTPHDLKELLQIIRHSLASGEIREDPYWPDGQLYVPQLPFSALPPEGPWPDYFEYYFRCVDTGVLFRLSVETYHGSGGTWQPLLSVSSGEKTW